MDILDTDIDVPCPKCAYPIWVRLVEVVAGATVTCPACRCRIRLVDESGSAQNLNEQIGQSLNRLTSALKGLG